MLSSNKRGVVAFEPEVLEWEILQAEQEIEWRVQIGRAMKLVKDRWREYTCTEITSVSF